MDAKKLFEILVRENADMLTVYIRSVVRNAALADDLFQETMLTAWRRLDDFDTDRPFGPWLRGIARRLILAHRSRSRRDFFVCDEEILEVLDDQVEQFDRRPGDTWQDKVEFVRECIAALPEHYRSVIEGRYQDGLGPRAVAEKLRMSLETVKKRLQRARSQLQQCVERKLAGEAQ